MSAKTIKLHGDSDDFICIVGSKFNEEIEVSDIETPFEASDGTSGAIFFNGQWNIQVHTEGESFIEVVESVGHEDDHEHKECIGLPPYSDVLLLDNRIKYIDIDGIRFTR
jgi:hypothetical protein